MTRPNPHPTHLEAVAHAAASVVKERDVSEQMRRIQELADRLTTEVDPNYKTEWERGFDYGMESAGRALQRILDAP